MFTVLFEYCRVSESALQRILESFIPNKLAVSFQDIKRKVVAGLVQVMNSRKLTLFLNENPVLIPVNTEH